MAVGINGIVGATPTGLYQPGAAMMPTSNSYTAPINTGVPQGLLNGAISGTQGVLNGTGSIVGAGVGGAQGVLNGTGSVVGGAVGGANNGVAAGAPGSPEWIAKILANPSMYPDAVAGAKIMQQNIAAGKQFNGNSLTITSSDPWLSADQLAAKNGTLNSGGGGTGSSGGGSSGGGGSGGAAPVAPPGGGLGLAGTGPAPVGSTPGQLQGGTTQTGPVIGYQDPGGINSNNPVGYGNPGQGGNGSTSNVQMQQADPNAALNQYQSTAGYQLLNSPGAYQQSPGYQYAMDQAMNQVQNGASARGMLESGAVLKSMQQTASGLAQQDYGNWWNRQNQLYGDYQNRLQGLAGGPTGSADAMTAGANAAQGNLQTGSNLGSLFGQQGTSGMGGIINTAAAQSSNMINAGQQQATVNSTNQATQLAGATLGSKGTF